MSSDSTARVVGSGKRIIVMSMKARENSETASVQKAGLSKDGGSSNKAAIGNRSKNGSKQRSQKATGEKQSSDESLLTSLVEQRRPQYNRTAKKIGSELHSIIEQHNLTCGVDSGLHIPIGTSSGGVFSHMSSVLVSDMRTNAQGEKELEASSASKSVKFSVKLAAAAHRRIEELQKMPQLSDIEEQELDHLNCDLNGYLVVLTNVCL